MKNIFPIEDLKDWFLSNKRSFPWRETQDPYAIWVSEVMLQQTQAVVVVPYFLRWMHRFPNIRILAEAEEKEVIKIWEGLGYYSRARNLHEGARYLIQQGKDTLPNSEEELMKIKGLGPYTIGAILSFAFHQRKAAVDGNVLRVIARCFQIEDDIAKAATQKKFRQLVEQLLPVEEPWIISEALIELGATICQRKPKCRICPLSKECLSYRNYCTDRLPVKSKGPAITHLYRSVTVIAHQGNYLVKKGKKGEIMADLYEFPFFETKEEGLVAEKIIQKVKEEYVLNTHSILELPLVTHGFTRYQVRLTPFLLEVNQAMLIQEFEWLSLEELQNRPFSSGHRRILQHLLNLTVFPPS